MIEPELLARSLARLLLVISERNREEVPQACDEAKKVLFGYLESESSAIRQAKPKWQKESPYWRQ